MPRKSLKSAGPAPRSSSKRAAPAPPARESKRARATTRKSYVEPDTDTDDAVDSKRTKKSSTSDDDDAAVSSVYEDQSENDASSVVESEPDEDEDASEEDSQAKKSTPRGRSAKTSKLPLHKKHVDEQDLLKPGAKLAPGTQLIIKKPKARDPGDTPYTDETIHPNTMLFLQDLAANNDRQWLKLKRFGFTRPPDDAWRLQAYMVTVHDPDYRAALQDFTTFTEQVTQKVIEADETVPELPVKDVIFRIYRDVRFSKDATPYKSHFSAAWSRTGRKGPYAHYYVHIEPNGRSFVGGGYWQPDATSLAKLRRDVDRKPHKIKAVLKNAAIRSAFLGNVANDDKKAVKAFTGLAMNQSNALKRNPKGYDHEHRDIGLLRLRNFTMGRQILDDEVTGPNGLDRIAELIHSVEPFITYLNSVVMPDEDSSDSSENEDEDDGDSDAENDGES